MRYDSKCCLRELEPEFLSKHPLPLGVISTARVPSLRLIHPLSKLWVQIAEPTIPARCGRRSLQSRQGRQSTRPDFRARCARMAVIADAAEKLHAHVGHDPAIAGQLRVARRHQSSPARATPSWPAGWW